MYKNYSHEPEPKEEGEVMVIDLGITNIAVTVKEDGDAKIYSGRCILLIQRYFNKEIAKLQSIVITNLVGERSGVSNYQSYRGRGEDK